MSSAVDWEIKDNYFSYQKMESLKNLKDDSLRAYIKNAVKVLRETNISESVIADSLISIFFKVEDLDRLLRCDDYNKALSIVGRIYNEQEDRSKHAAAGHFVRVSNCLDTEEEKVVGLLHDVIEDGYLTLEVLRRFGFSNNILEALEILNNHKEKYKNYDEYIDQIIASGNLIALRVKFWDMEDNQSPLRVNDLDEKRKEKAMNKYKPYIPRIVIAIKEIEEEQALVREKRLVR